MIKKILIATAFTALVTTASAKEYTYEELMKMDQNQISQLTTEEIAPVCRRYEELSKRAIELRGAENKEYMETRRRVSWTKGGLGKCDELVNGNFMKEAGKKIERNLSKGK